MLIETITKDAEALSALATKHEAEVSAIHNRYQLELMEARMISTRLAMSSWLKGTGIEVGAGSRPFIVPDRLKVFYGDIRDDVELHQYFGQDAAVKGGERFIDAQTFVGIPEASVDFVISAHVLEHLYDPIGSVEQALRVIRPGGLFLLTVPDMRHIFDRNRPLTTLEHLLSDYQDGGEGTKLEAHIEVIQYVLGHTRVEAEQFAPINLANGMDIHVHTWTLDSLSEMLTTCEKMFPMTIEAQVVNVNENIFAIRRV